MLNEGQYQGEFSANFNMRAIKAQAWSVVSYTSERFGWTKLFRVLRHSINGMSGVGMTLREIDPSIWSAGSVTMIPTAPIGSKYDPTQEIALTGLSATGYTGNGVKVVEDGASISWTAAPANVRRTDVEVKLATDTFWQSFGPYKNDITSAIAFPLLSGSTYNIRARHISVHEVAGPWATINFTVGTNTNFDATALIKTERFPNPPPSNWSKGSLYFNAENKPFIYNDPVVSTDEGPVTTDEGVVTTSGYDDVQDLAIPQALDAAAAAQSAASAAQSAADAANAAIAQIDDDDVITISEKVEVLIPGASAFEALYVAVLTIAAAAGVSVTTLNTRRTAWLAALNAVSPAWNNISAPSPVVRNSLDTARSQYTNELNAVQAAAIEGMTSAKQITVVPPVAQIVYRDWLGAVKDSQYPRTLTPKVDQGGVDIRTRNDVIYAITTTGAITATVNNATGSADKGRISVTGGSSGSILLTITVSGVAQPVFTIPFTNEDDNPPTTGFSGNTGGSDSSLEDVTTTSFTTITRQDAGESVFLIDITSGQTINGTAPLTYIKSGTSGTPTAMIAKWQYRLQGSATWIDFVSGTSVAGTGAFWVATEFEAMPGEITANQSKGGLAAGTYECQLVAAKNNSAAGNLQIVSGAATVSKS